MNKIFIGIDNGLSGALVALSGDSIVEKLVMPVFNSAKTKREYDLAGILNFLKKYHDPIIILESAQAFPGQGVSSTFKTGRGFGLIEGMIFALGYKYMIVRPQKWQSKMFEGINHDDTKQASMIIAQRLFPKEDFRATERSKNQHDGLTDACLLAVYGSIVL